MINMTGYPLITTEWMNQAACRGHNTNLFFPKRGDNTRTALTICEQCPVTQQCAEYAQKLGQHHGIWGGQTQTELHPKGRRHQIRRLPPPHGTERRYQHHKCRCQRCTEAHTAATLERRRQT